MKFGEIRNRQGEKLDYAFHEGNLASRDIVVIGHGVTGHKDRPLHIAYAEGLAEAGFNALRFSFAGNGQSEGRFEDAIISKEAGDLGSVIDHLDGFRVCYSGHSMGGAVGVTRALEDRRIQFLISLAGMARTQEFAQREFGALVRGKDFMWDKPECPLGVAYMDEMARIGSLVDRAPEIEVPWLFVHGTADDVVPIKDSRDMFRKAGPPKRFHEIERADHLFSDRTDELVEIVTGWLREQLQ